METSGCDHPNNQFPLSFYYRIADQLITQANQCRNEKKKTHLSLTLKRYISLLSIIHQHKSYSTYSSKEKLYHDKIHQEFIKELELLKSQFGPNTSSTIYSDPAPSNSSIEFEGDGITEMETQSFHCFDQENLVVTSSEKVNSCNDCSSSCSTPSLTNVKMQRTVSVHLVTQSSPSPVLSFVHNVPQALSVSHINVSDSQYEYLNSSYQDIHISSRLMEDFLALARDNTNKDLETCGVLGAFLKDRVFYVTTLIIPKQEATSSSCQATNEEDIFSILDEHSLFPIGWIHTHPSQTCFMSSIDLHTQFSYQVMLPEAVAVVMAPTDTSRSYGIFRLTNPGGFEVIKECDERGFHSHRETSDGRPLYEDCSNVYINPNLRFEIFDLR